MKIKQKPGSLVTINNQKFKLIIPRIDIEEKYLELAIKIRDDLSSISKNNPPIIMGVITGGIYTMVDMTRSLSIVGFDYYVDTIGVKRYDEDEMPGRISITKNPSGYINGKNIIVTEDVVDRGDTINFIKEYLMIHKPSSIHFLALGWKKEISKLNFEIDYVGFDLKPEWLIAEGMDNNQLERGRLGIWQKIN